MQIKISKIKVRSGHRATVPAHTEELAKSIAEVGLLNPLTMKQDYIALNVANSISWGQAVQAYN